MLFGVRWMPSVEYDDDRLPSRHQLVGGIVLSGCRIVVRSGLLAKHNRMQVAVCHGITVRSVIVWE
jgi:hypothetical protein